jgi:hypothetical protein
MSDAPSTTTVDTWSYRLVVGGLVLCLLAAVVGMTALSFLGKEVPPDLPAIAMPIIAALAAILTPLAMNRVAKTS